MVLFLHCIFDLFYYQISDTVNALKMKTLAGSSNSAKNILLSMTMIALVMTVFRKQVPIGSPFLTAQDEVRGGELKFCKMNSVLKMSTEGSVVKGYMGGTLRHRAGDHVLPCNTQKSSFTASLKSLPRIVSFPGDSQYVAAAKA